MREQGVAGFVMNAGVVQSRETNHKLLGSNRWRTAADMLSNVSIIAAGLRYTLNLTARPKWKADPVSDTAEAKAAAEFVDDIIENMDRSWSRVIRASAMYRFHGFQINEWVASKRDDGKIGIQTVEARPQHTIERWDIDPNGGVQGVWQRDPQTSKEIYLPRKKIVYLVDDSFTDRPDGIGVFRHLVEDWNQLKVYMKLERMGFQRDLTGIPIGRVPLAVMNKLVQDGKITAAQRDQMIEGIRDFVSLETKSDTTGLLLDSAAYTAKGDTGETISGVMQWGIDLITGEQNSVDALGAAIKRTQFDMALVMGTSSLLTGREGEGSRALSEDQSRNLYLTVNQSLNDMAEAYDRDIIGPIWAMNGMDEKLRPKLTHEDASFKDVEQIAATLQKMAAAGAILAPDDPAINDLRNLMGISEAEEMSVEDLALIRGAGKTPPEDKGGQGGAPGGKPGGGKPANSNEPNDATTGAPQRRGAAQKWDGWVEKYNPHHVASGEHGGEFTSGSGGGGDGGPVTIPRKFQPRNFAELKDHPAVDSIDDYRPDGMHVNLATGFAWSEQHSFGVETVGQALRLMREVYWEGDGPPPWTQKFNPYHVDSGPEGGQFTSATMDTGPGNPPEPGKPFLVYRAASQDDVGLTNRNAGNGTGVGVHLARLDDAMAPRYTGQATSGRDLYIHAYKVTLDDAPGQYHLFNSGVGGGNGVGYSSNNGIDNFSFGSSGYKAQYLGSFPASDVLAHLRAGASAGERSSYTTFDDWGGRLTGEAINAVHRERFATAAALDRMVREGRDTSTKANPYHRPAGDERGGEFTSASGGARAELQQQTDMWRQLGDRVGTDIAKPQQWLLDNGDEMGPVIDPGAIPMGKPKHCYENTFKALMYGQVDPNEWAYTEGVTYIKGIPFGIDHAWLSNKNGDVLDLTIPNDGEHSYFGVPYKWDFVREQTMKNSYYGLHSNGVTWDPELINEPVGDKRAWPKIAKFNPYHKPAGPGGGQFTTATGGGGTIMVKDKLGNEAPVTEDSSLAKYLVENPDGTYSLDPQREKLHEEIVKHYLAGVSPATGTPVMYMTGGGPASGKSAILVGGNEIPGQHDAVHVDPDAIKNQLPEYREMFAAGAKNAAGYVHEESSLIRRRVEAAARAGNYNVVLDTTGDNSVEKLEGNISAYRAAGYRVNALYASLDTELAVRLADERGRKTGRYVPEDFLRATHRNVSNTFVEAAQRRRIFDSVKLYDTNENGNPRLVATGDRSSFTINDRKLWDDFVAKGKGP